MSLTSSQHAALQGASTLHNGEARCSGMQCWNELFCAGRWSSFPAAICALVGPAASRSLGLTTHARYAEWPLRRRCRSFSVERVSSSLICLLSVAEFTLKSSSEACARRQWARTKQLMSGSSRCRSTSPLSLRRDPPSLMLHLSCQTLGPTAVPCSRQLCGTSTSVVTGLFHGLRGLIERASHLPSGSIGTQVVLGAPEPLAHPSNRRRACTRLLWLY